ncbi:phage holin [Alkalibacterium sp. MB6]|uniref:phage holin n=1 Tax=Alkalibacterium sp. MB6 TaxID=2081965 RepID=UPI001F1FF722|nr:phage holin [Alkalibacterium sp. MB6]
MKNHFYDIGKWVVLIFIPSFAVLISGLGDLYGWEGTATMVTSINLINVFLGSLLQLSSFKYNLKYKTTGGTNNATKYIKSR